MRINLQQRTFLSEELLYFHDNIIQMRAHK